MMSSSYQARVIGLLRPLKDVTVTAGESATFDCELSYEGIPVEWYLQGKKLEPSDKVRRLNFFPYAYSSFLTFTPLPLFFFLIYFLLVEILRHSSAVVLNGNSSLAQIWHILPGKGGGCGILQVCFVQREAKTLVPDSVQDSVTGMMNYFCSGSLQLLWQGFERCFQEMFFFFFFSWMLSCSPILHIRGLRGFKFHFRHLFWLSR